MEAETDQTFLVPVPAADHQLGPAFRASAEEAAVDLLLVPELIWLIAREAEADPAAGADQEAGLVPLNQVVQVVATGPERGQPPVESGTFWTSTDLSVPAPSPVSLDLAETVPMSLFRLVLEELSHHAPVEIDQRSCPADPAEEGVERIDHLAPVTVEIDQQFFQAIPEMGEIDHVHQDPVEEMTETDLQDLEAVAIVPAFYPSIPTTTDHVHRDPVMAVTDHVHHVPEEGETMTVSPTVQDVQIGPVIRIAQGDQVVESTSGTSIGATTRSSTIARTG